MADVNRFSEGLIDMAERFADVVESAQGPRPEESGWRREVVDPACGRGGSICLGYQQLELGTSDEEADEPGQGPRH